MGLTTAIDLTQKQHDKILSLLQEYLPNTTAWAYGSRVKWTSRSNSDLDMVVFATPKQSQQVSELRTAFEESNLPFQVDIFVWDTVSDNFRKRIEAEHVVLTETINKSKNQQNLSENEPENESWLYRPQFPESWKRCSLYSLAEWVNGIAFRKIQFSDSGKPVIKIAEIKNGISEQTKFTLDEFDKSVHIQAGDLLFSWSGQPETSIGTFCWRGPDGWLNQHIFRVTPNPAIDRTFFYYLLEYLKPNFVEIARNKQTTGLGHVTKTDLMNMHVAIPSLSKQVAIAEKLNALDDKIELNHRMSSTLEEMARALFKSWFIDFDPVYAKMERRWLPGQSLPGLPAEYFDLFPANIVGSKLGSVPEGWHVRELASVVKQMRIIETPGQYPDDIYKHYSIPAYDLNKVPKLERGSDIRSSKLRVFKDVTLVSKLNPDIERVWLINHEVADRSVCSPEFLVLESQMPFQKNYLYCLMRSKIFREQIQSLVTGTSKSHQRAKSGAVLSLPVLLPDELIISLFEMRVADAMKRSTDNIFEIQILSDLRDELLQNILAEDMMLYDAE